MHETFVGSREARRSTSLAEGKTKSRSPARSSAATLSSEPPLRASSAAFTSAEPSDNSACSRHSSASAGSTLASASLAAKRSTSEGKPCAVAEVARLFCSESSRGATTVLNQLGLPKIGEMKAGAYL